MRVLVDEIGQREQALQRAAALRAGLVTSAIYNVNRKKGTAAYQPRDFVREEPKTLSPEQMRAAMDRWAGTVNRSHEA